MLGGEQYWEALAKYFCLQSRFGLFTLPTLIDGGAFHERKMSMKTVDDCVAMAKRLEPNGRIDLSEGLSRFCPVGSPFIKGIRLTLLDAHGQAIESADSQTTDELHAKFAEKVRVRRMRESQLKRLKSITRLWNGQESLQLFLVRLLLFSFELRFRDRCGLWKSLRCGRFRL